MKWGRVGGRGTAWMELVQASDPNYFLPPNRFPCLPHLGLALGRAW